MKDLDDFDLSSNCFLNMGVMTKEILDILKEMRKLPREQRLKLVSKYNDEYLQKEIFDKNWNNK